MSRKSIAVVTGYKSKASGSIGCWIVLTERDDDMNILCVKSVRIDGKRKKAGIFYTLVNGKIIEAL